MWNEEIKLPYKQYSVSDSQDYFEPFIKINKAFTDNSPIKIYINKVEKKSKFKIKKGSIF